MAQLGAAPQDVATRGQDDEEQTEENVAQVGVDVVEVGQIAQRVGAQEVVVAQVLVARIVHHLTPSTPTDIPNDDIRSRVSLAFLL